MRKVILLDFLPDLTGQIEYWQIGVAVFVILIIGLIIAESFQNEPDSLYDPTALDENDQPTVEEEIVKSERVVASATTPTETREPEIENFEEPEPEKTETPANTPENEELEAPRNGYYASEADEELAHLAREKFKRELEKMYNDLEKDKQAFLNEKNKHLISVKEEKIRLKELEARLKEKYT